MWCWAVLGNTLIKISDSSLPFVLKTTGTSLVSRRFSMKNNLTRNIQLFVGWMLPLLMGIACYSNPKEIDKQNSTEIVANDSSTIFHLLAGRKNQPISLAESSKTPIESAGHFGAARRVEGWSLPHLQHHGLTGAVGQDAWNERCRSCLYSGRLVDCYNPRAFLFQSFQWDLLFSIPICRLL